MLQIGQQHTSLFMNSSDMHFLQTDGIYNINGKGAITIHEEKLLEDTNPIKNKWTQ